MHEGWVRALETWHEFYLLIGTAGATLTGLLFVLVSLGARTVAERVSTGVRAFLSPNAVHFCATLIVAAVLIIPNVPSSIVGVFLFLGALGLLGYLAHTKVHRRWRENKLPVVDWIWYVGLPILSYVLLLVSSVAMLLGRLWSMYGIAVGLIFLLVIGIRNSWDLVIFMARREQK
jgi:hypothetical protein